MVKENGMIMMSEKEYEETVANLKKEKNNMHRLLFALLKRVKSNADKDILVTRSDFVKLYNAAVEDMFDHMESGDDDNLIYGHDVTVHWNGIYCNCSDGATVANYIIPAIEDVMEEYGDEEE